MEYDFFDFIFSAKLQKFPTKHYKIAVASKIATKPIKNTKTLVSKCMATANTATKAKSTTTTKITKLVLKPKSTTPLKNASVLKMTTKAYNTKPVTIKSRSTVSTKLSHESTYRIRNLKKSPPTARYGTRNKAISVKSEQTTHQLTTNTNYFDKNQVINKNKSFDMITNGQNANITSLNTTKKMNSPILQEITLAVLNGSNVVSRFVTDFDVNYFEKVNCPSKSIEHSVMNSQQKKYDVNKARKFVQMQREKWKTVEKLEKKKSKSPATKDEIKQRLFALRMNTLSIVEKNVQNARRSSIPPANAKNAIPKKLIVAPKKLTNSPRRKKSGKQIMFLKFRF